MPPRTPEETRDQIVAMRKAGKSYGAIRAALRTRNDIIARTLKEAGLTDSSRKIGAAQHAPAPAQAAVAPSADQSEAYPAAAYPAPDQPEPPRAGTVDEFMPKKSKPKRSPQSAPPAPAWKEYQCGSCRALFRERESIRPSQCPGCEGAF